MNIKETFLNLTKETYPHGTESELFHLLPKDLVTDEFGKIIKIILRLYFIMILFLKSKTRLLL